MDKRYAIGSHDRCDHRRSVRNYSGNNCYYLYFADRLYGYQNYFMAYGLYPEVIERSFKIAGD